MSAAPKIPMANPLFDKRLVQTLVDNVLKTLNVMAKTESKPGKPFIAPQFQMRGDISGVVGFKTPPLEGTLLITYQKETIIFIVENMLGERHPDINSDITDAVGELTNMIYGSSKTALNGMGYKFEMAIPKVHADLAAVPPFEKGATLVIPFSIQNGTTFFVEFTVK